MTHYVLPQDIYRILDDGLKQDLIYAWSLPHNPRFAGKIQMVLHIASSLSSATDPIPVRLLIAYVVRILREIVKVGSLC